MSCPSLSAQKIRSVVTVRARPRTCSGVKVNRQPAPRSLIRLAPRHTGKLVGELGLRRFPQSQNVFGRKHVG